MNDIELDKEITEMVGHLVYHNLLRVERTSSIASFDTIVVSLKSDQSLGMHDLRRFIKLGFELRTVHNDFEIRRVCDSESISGHTELHFVRSPSNIKVSEEKEAE